MLEVKYSGEMPRWLGPAFESLEPARSFSKFQLGMTALGHTPDAPETEASPVDASDPPGFALTSFVAA